MRKTSPFSEPNFITVLNLQIPQIFLNDRYFAALNFITIFNLEALQIFVYAPVLHLKNQPPSTLHFTIHHLSHFNERH